MANEKESVGVVAKEVKTSVKVNVELERAWFDYLDKDTGKRHKGVSLRVRFDYAGESFRLKIDKGDGKLLNYILKHEGLRVVNADGMPMDEAWIEEVLREEKRGNL